MMKIIHPDPYDEASDFDCVIVEGGEGEYELGETVTVKWETKPDAPGYVRDYSNGLWSIQVNEMSEQ